MDPDILFPSHIPVIYTPEWTRWSQAPPRGPGGSRWIRAFIYHKCSPGINSCQEKALLAKLRTALKGDKEPQESWVFLLNSLNFEALHNSLIAQNNHSGKRKEKEKNTEKKTQTIFFFCGDFSYPVVCWDNSCLEFPGIPSDHGVGSILVCRVDPEPDLGEIWVKSGRNPCPEFPAGWTEQGISVLDTSRGLSFLPRISELQ